SSEKRDLLSVAYQRALESEGLYDAEVSIVLTTDEQIRELNRTYRGIDSPTDVLSFPLLEPDAAGEPIDPERGAHGAPAPGEPVALGDIVISLPRAVAQAEQHGHGLRRELACLTGPGTRHLLGYDHVTPGVGEALRGRAAE